MKFLSICLLALLFSPLLFADQPPTIIFKVIGAKNKWVSCARPVEGKCFHALSVEDSLDANGEFRITNTEKVAGPYVFFYKKQYRLFVMPGREYKVTIDPGNKEKPVTVDGPEPEGEEELLKLNLTWDGAQSTGFRLYRQDTIFANTKQKVLQALDSCLHPFEQLYDQHKISKALYGYAKSCIKNYYGTVLSCTMIMPVTKAVYNKDSAGYDAARLKQIGDRWRDILSVVDIMDPLAMTTDTYQAYFYYYNTFYLSYHLYLMKGNQLIKGVDHSDIEFHSIGQYIKKEPLREYLLAQSLKMFILEDQFQIYIPDLYNEFISQYPRSKYIPYLSEGIEKVKQFYITSKKEFTASYQFVPQSDSIATVEELLSRFKGKTLYIDLWATWCGPCKAQFAFKSGLDSVLKSKGMEMLYISLDKASSEDKWKNMIRYYGLEGHHIMASEQLVNDIYKVFSNGKGISIPKYAICKDGKLVLPNAKAPGDKEMLYKQIESVL